MTAARLIDVVGLTFVDGYPANVLRLRDLDEGRQPNAERLPIVLRRNPANQYDANAIEVHQPAVGMLGHLPKELAAELAPLMDAGTIVAAEVAAVRVMPGHEDRPGVSIAVRKVTVPVPVDPLAATQRLLAGAS